MAGRAFLPSDELLSAVTALVPQDPAGADAFFRDPGGVEALRRAVAALPGLGRHESDREMAERMERDLARCADTLRDRLGHPVRSLAWPWGASCAVSRDIARSLGFRLLFGTSHGPNVPPAGPPGSDPDPLHRFKVGEHGPLRLLTRLAVYSRPGLARLYGAIRVHKGRRG
jgi:peptidoglycan/xylan/chitin deacetylase (PgdA/CDA1 family)